MHLAQLLFMAQQNEMKCYNADEISMNINENYR